MPAGGGATHQHIRVPARSLRLARCSGIAGQNPTNNTWRAGLKKTVRTGAAPARCLGGQLESMLEACCSANSAHRGKQGRLFITKFERRPHVCGQSVGTGPCLQRSAERTESGTLLHRKLVPSAWLRHARQGGGTRRQLRGFCRTCATRSNGPGRGPARRPRVPGHPASCVAAKAKSYKAGMSLSKIFRCSIRTPGSPAAPPRFRRSELRGPGRVMRQSGSGGRRTGSVGCRITSVFFFCWVTCVFFSWVTCVCFLGSLVSFYSVRDNSLQREPFFTSRPRLAKKCLRSVWIFGQGVLLSRV